jgi:hypothetical protein
MPWTAEDDVNLEDAPYVASSSAVAGVRGWLEERQIDAADSLGVVHETREFVFQCKPGAFGELQTEEALTVNGQAFRYAGRMPHGPSIFDHLVLIRDLG